MTEEKFNLSEKIQEIVKAIGMKRAEEEQNAILKKYRLTDLNKKQIQGLADLISYVNKCHEESKKEFIRRLKERMDEEKDFCDKANVLPSIHPRVKTIIDKLRGETNLKEELKTLKDLAKKGYLGNFVDRRELKAEAVKVLKAYYHPDKTTMPIKAWIEFFNLTEEDLK